MKNSNYGAPQRAVSSNLLLSKYLRARTILTILFLTNESTFTNQTPWRPKFVTVIAYLYEFSSHIELPLAFIFLNELGKTSTRHRFRNPTSEKDEPLVSGFECFTLGKGVRCIHEWFLKVDCR
jgi:hypothetical protein